MRKIKFILIIAAAITILSAGQFDLLSSSGSSLAELLKENERIKRLEEYKDNKTTLKLKLQVLDVINANRTRHGLKPVKLDILACRVASKSASEAVKGKYFGHWNLRGEKPYHRYAFAGGLHHVSENAAMQWRSIPLKKNFNNILKLIISAHTAMYNETPPDDGHRKNIINPWHTHVGLGFSLIDNDFRYYEEFLDKYLEFDPINTQTKTGSAVMISGRVIVPGYGVYFVVVHYEPFPSPMTPAMIKQKSSYHDFTNTRAASLPFWDINYNHHTKRFNFSFTTSKSGLYYVQVFIKKGHTGKEKPGSASTKGLTPVSGIVIRAR